MILHIEGHHLPGATCGPYTDVHVGLQERTRPTELVRADAGAASWSVPIEVVETSEGPDFRGPHVQGRRGDRFVYLTWGAGSGDEFVMFRRAKLMLLDVPDPALPEVTARVHLTDEAAMPRCARLRPPALEWV
ncbi:MAG: DUF5990 family protein [Marmoricola sp.]